MNDKKTQSPVDQEKKIKMLKNLKDRIKELDEINEVDNLVRDNKFYFTIKDKEYRIRKPNNRERNQLREIKAKKFAQLIKSEEYILEEQLIESLSKQGKDINIINKKMLELEQKINQKLLVLAKTENKKKIEELKKEIVEYKDKQLDLSAEKTDLLQYSLERILRDYINNYTCYLLLEKKNKNNWIRVFDSYEDYMNSEDEDLITTALYNLHMLVVFDE